MTEPAEEVVDAEPAPIVYYVADQRRELVDAAPLTAPQEVVDDSSPDPSIQSLIATMLLLVTAFMFQPVDQSNILYASSLIAVLFTALSLLIVSTVRLRKHTKLRREFQEWVEVSGDDSEVEKYGISSAYKSTRKATIVNIVFSFLNVSWQATVIIIGMVNWMVTRVGL